MKKPRRFHPIATTLWLSAALVLACAELRAQGLERESEYPRNKNPTAPWNNPVYRNDPLAPHNHPVDRTSPTKPWNQLTGDESDLTAEERRAYGLPPKRERRSFADEPPPRNDNPARVWNSPVYRDNPLAPHNHPAYGPSPTKPWNRPGGDESELTAEERRAYGLSPRRESRSWPDDPPPRNKDPFRVWNSPLQRDNPFAPHNSAIDRDSPFKPWNSPFGRESDLTPDERRGYGLPLDGSRTR